MPAQACIPKKFSQRRLAIAAILVGLAAYLLINTHERRSSAVRLQQEIRWRDGTCEFGTPTLQRFCHWLLSDGVIMYEGVGLTSSEFHHDWLEDTDFLWGLHVESLVVEGSLLNGIDVARLIDEHPIRVLIAPGLEEADKAAAALGSADRAAAISLDQSDLSDAGLRQLPLECVEALDIVGSAVTADGIDELRRCRKLIELRLDGNQIDRQSVESLSTIDSLQVLGVDGDVTEETLEALHELRLDNGRLWIDGSRVSESQIAKLHAALRNRFLNRDP